jgi:DNA-binding transcriptional LysR family regulator
MFVNLDHTLEFTRRTARGEQGRISIGYTSAAAFHPLVSRVIREFRTGFPLVSVTLTEGFPHDLIERMRNDQIDIAFIRTPVANPEGVVVEQLQDEPVAVALPSGHVLARSKNGNDVAIPLQALANETFIVYGRPNGALTLQSNAIVAACHAAGFSARIGHVVPHHLSTLNLVAAGLGIAVVSNSLKRMNIEGVVYRRLKGVTQLKIPLDLVSRRGDASAVVRQFLKLAKQTAKNFRAQ